MDAGNDLCETVVAHYKIMPAVREMFHAFRPQLERLDEAYSERAWIEDNGALLGESKCGVWNLGMME